MTNQWRIGGESVALQLVSVANQLESAANQHESVAHHLVRRTGALELVVPEVVALRDLKAGDEIIVSYNNNESRQVTQSADEDSLDHEADWEAFRQLAVPKPRRAGVKLVE